MIPENTNAAIGDGGAVQKSSRQKEPASNSQRKSSKQANMSWRDVLPVHPAAELFPMMSETELRALGEDIKKHGLASRIVLWMPHCGSKEVCLIDGRNRLDAMELVGLDTASVILPREASATHADPYEYVVAANIRRRHLTAEQRLELIAKVIEAKPGMSDRAIAKQVKADHKTVGKVRKKKEQLGTIPQLKTREGADGKVRQPAKRKPAEQKIFDSLQAAHAPSPYDTVERALVLIEAMDDDERSRLFVELQSRYGGADDPEIPPFLRRVSP